MFSGIVRYGGVVTAARDRAGGGLTLAVRCEGVGQERPQRGDSIAIDGVCLTVTAFANDELSFDVIPETLACTTLALRRAGDAVNVEYALRYGERIGGHMVYGHVDAFAEVLARAPEGQGERVRIAIPQALGGKIALKAFVAVDGISLTVAAASPDWFEIALIPETLARTTLGRRAPGSRVNLEIEPQARYTSPAKPCT